MAEKVTTTSSKLWYCFDLTLNLQADKKCSVRISLDSPFVCKRREREIPKADKNKENVIDYHWALKFIVIAHAFIVHSLRVCSCGHFVCVFMNVYMYTHIIVLILRGNIHFVQLSFLHFIVNFDHLLFCMFGLLLSMPTSVNQPKAFHLRKLQKPKNISVCVCVCVRACKYYSVEMIFIIIIHLVSTICCAIS